ncbi:hypothetical protein PR048_014676 [Dryococelus australis]|uniref:Uncharacterized protein n=1 Tax=Dryococelus australis TaxID=614101 RepID=A0ABQ9HF39_9NEOP|nr:hypothetical protein PR048_014676 [Dryococelus australis]
MDSLSHSHKRLSPETHLGPVPTPSVRATLIITVESVLDAQFSMWELRSCLQTRFLILSLLSLHENEGSPFKITFPPAIYALRVEATRKVLAKWEYSEKTHQPTAEYAASLIYVYPPGFQPCSLMYSAALIRRSRGEVSAAAALSVVRDCRASRQTLSPPRSFESLLFPSGRSRRGGRVLLSPALCSSTNRFALAPPYHPAATGHGGELFRKGRRLYSAAYLPGAGNSRVFVLPGRSALPPGELRATVRLPLPRRRRFSRFECCEDSFLQGKRECMSGITSHAARGDGVRSCEGRDVTSIPSINIDLSGGAVILEGQSRPDWARSGSPRDLVTEDTNRFPERRTTCSGGLFADLSRYTSSGGRAASADPTSALAATRARALLQSSLRGLRSSFGGWNFYIHSPVKVPCCSLVSGRNAFGFPKLHCGYWLLLCAPRMYSTEQSPAYLATFHHTPLLTTFLKPRPCFAFRLQLRLMQTKLNRRGQRSAFVRTQFNKGATVAERLACSPPPRQSVFNPRPVPDDDVGRRVFSGISITLIGSQDLGVKSRPYLFTHSRLSTAVGRSPPGGHTSTLTSALVSKLQPACIPDISLHSRRPHLGVSHSSFLFYILKSNPRFYCFMKLMDRGENYHGQNIPSSLWGDRAYLSEMRSRRHPGRKRLCLLRRSDGNYARESGVSLRTHACTRTASSLRVSRSYLRAGRTADTEYASAVHSRPSQHLPYQPWGEGDLNCTVERHDGSTACIARSSDVAIGVRVSVVRIAPSLLDLERGPRWCSGQTSHLPPRRTRFDSWWGHLADFCKWESCWTIHLVCGFSPGSPVSPALAFRRCSVLISLHSCVSEAYNHGSAKGDLWTGIECLVALTFSEPLCTQFSRDQTTCVRGSLPARTVAQSNKVSAMWQDITGQNSGRQQANRPGGLVLSQKRGNVASRALSPRAGELSNQIDELDTARYSDSRGHCSFHSGEPQLLLTASPWLVSSHKGGNRLYLKKYRKLLDHCQIFFIRKCPWLRYGSLASHCHGDARVERAGGGGGETASEASPAAAPRAPHTWRADVMPAARDVCWSID